MLTSSDPSCRGSCSSVFSRPSQLTEFVAEELLERREPVDEVRVDGTLMACALSTSSSSSSRSGKGSDWICASESRTVTIELVGNGISAGKTSAILRMSNLNSIYLL